MEQNVEIILEGLYEEYKKGERGNFEKVSATSVGLSKNEFINACEFLKQDGFLPDFTCANQVTFIGSLGDELIAIFDEMIKNGE